MQDQVKDKLAQLRQSLAETKELDEESIHLLHALESEIQTVLAGQPNAGLESKIEKQAVEFDGQHPQISSILRDVMDVLSKMGI